jgi:hypothetical protein
MVGEVLLRQIPHREIASTVLDVIASPRAAVDELRHPKRRPFQNSHQDDLFRIYIYMNDDSPHEHGPESVTHANALFLTSVLISCCFQPF